MELDQCLSSREEINGKLRLSLDDATDKWGVKVLRVDVKNINPPQGVRVTMEKQMTAERNRRALVLQAEGERQAAITRAEGEKQAAIAMAEGNKTSAILRAEGAAQARMLTAEAEAEAIARITDGMAHARPQNDSELEVTTSAGRNAPDINNPAQYLITTRYIEGLKDMAKSDNARVIFMPVQTSRVLGAVGAIRELFMRIGERT